MVTEDQKQLLISEAQKALENPTIKNSPTKYVAAVLTKSGNVYQGVSVFSDTYSLTLHGEQSALAHAAFHGENEIVAMACASTEDKKTGTFTNPCHMCKQLMYESQRRSGIPMLVILTNQLGETKEVQLSEMVSFPWPE